MRKTCSMQSRFRVFVYLLAALPLAVVDGRAAPRGLDRDPARRDHAARRAGPRRSTGSRRAGSPGSRRGSRAPSSTPTRSRCLTSPGHGFWGSAAGVASDGAFWRQQVLLLPGAVLRSTLAVAELSLLVAGVWSLLIPLTTARAARRSAPGTSTRSAAPCSSSPSACSRWRSRRTCSARSARSSGRSRRRCSGRSRPRRAPIGSARPAGARWRSTPFSPPEPQRSSC